MNAVFAKLHGDISNRERVEVLAEFRLEDVVTAPGHRALRGPLALKEMVGQLAAGRGDLCGDESILLGAFTRVDAMGAVSLASLECIDGNHRLAAGLLSGVWRTVGDLPADRVLVYVNGWRPGGIGPEPRWVPDEVARRSRLSPDRYSPVPESFGAKGATCQVPGELSSLDPVWAERDRGIPFRELVDRLR